MIVRTELRGRDLSVAEARRWADELDAVTAASAARVAAMLAEHHRTLHRLTV